MEQLSAELLSVVEPVRQNGTASETVGMSLMDILVVLAGRIRLIAIASVLLAICAAIAGHFMPRSFKAQAVIVTPQQPQSSIAAFAGALGGLAGAGVASQLGLKSPSDFYVSALKSRTIADEVIARFHLQDVYHQKLLSGARKILGKQVSVLSTGKDYLITISVEDQDARRAAAMANAFVDELYKLISRFVVNDASQRRLFFEQELGKEKDLLAGAEISLREVQRLTGLIIPMGQGEALIRSAMQLRGEISMREVALHATRTYATDDNPQVQLLQREIAAMQGQLNDLEKKGGGESSLAISAGKLPDAGLQYLRKLRDIKYHEAVYEVLAKQYEAARIDEYKQGPALQVIDRANVPDRPSGLSVMAFGFGGGLLGLTLGSIYVLGAHGLKTLLADPSRSKNLHSLMAAFKIQMNTRTNMPRGVN